MKKRRFSISMKMRIFVIIAVLTVSFVVAMMSYNINIGQIDSYYKRIAMNSAENIAAFTEPEFFLNLKNIAESEEFQAVREKAEQTEDESLVEDYLKQQNVWDEYSKIRKKMCTYLDNMDDIKYLYVIVLGDKDAKYDMYLLDDYDNPLYQTGNYEDREPELLGVDTSEFMEPTFTIDRWGSLCCAYAPIRDEDGTIICHVGCDVDMETVYNERKNYLAIIFLGAFAVTAVVLVLSVIFIGNVFEKPLKRLTQATKKFSPAKNVTYDEACVVNLDLKNIDEISDIYEVIRSTQMDTIDYLNDLSRLEKDNQHYMTSLKRARDDIKDKEVLLGKMSREVYRDTLTGVGSKAAYVEKADVISGQIVNGTAEFAIVMVDINDLKMINDRFGHKSGDVYIKGCCRIICDVFKNSPVFRIGGDEFVVVLIDDDYINREALTMQARAEFSKSFSRKDVPAYRRYSAAVGYAVFSDKDDSFDYVFRRADKAMYADKLKIKGKNGSYR